MFSVCVLRTTLSHTAVRSPSSGSSTSTQYFNTVSSALCPCDGLCNHFSVRRSSLGLHLEFSCHVPSMFYLGTVLSLSWPQRLWKQTTVVVLHLLRWRNSALCIVGDGHFIYPLCGCFSIVVLLPHFVIVI